MLVSADCARRGGAVRWLRKLRTFLFQPVACQQVVGLCLAIWVYAGVNSPKVLSRSRLFCMCRPRVTREKKYILNATFLSAAQSPGNGCLVGKLLLLLLLTSGAFSKLIHLGVAESKGGVAHPRVNGKQDFNTGWSEESGKGKGSNE